MAQNKVVEVYKGLPDWARGVVVVGGIAIAFYIGYTLIRRVRKNAELQADLQESDSAKTELEKLRRNGIVPTLSDSQVESMINALVESMNDCGTDEKAIYNQIKKVNNIADVQLLIAKWGVRYYRPCSVSSPISYSKYLFNNKAFGGNLSAWFNYDLTQTEITKINKILSDKGITFKF